MVRPSCVHVVAYYRPRFVSANIQVSLSQSRDEITAHVDKSIEASREATIQSIESFRDATAAEVRAVLAVSHQAVIAHLNSQLGSGNQPIAGVTAPVFHRIAYQAASECSLHCGCRCHSFARYRWTLTPLQKLLGSFVLEYRDQPPQSCTSTQCLGRGGRPWRSIRVGYTLPPWLLRSSLTILYSSNINGNPEMVLRLVNYLPWDVAHSRGLFGPIKKGDLEGLKELLRQGKASVHDRLLYRTNDRGALDYAVQLGNAAAVPLLLQAGADAHGIRNLILKRLIRGRPEDVSLASEFPVSAFLEDAEFTLLHKVVMGVAHLPLAEALSSPRCIRDVAGRSTAAFLSPLRIAALRDDGEACRLLVEAGAPIDDTDPARSRNTALHEACWNDNYRAARALVLLGASTTRKGSSDGGCALTIAAGAVRARSGTRLLRLILDNGGDVHSTDRKGGTPLLYAATFGSEADGGGGMDRLNLLIDRGSDVNHQDADGDTALVGTVAYNKILFAAALLRGGADPSITNAQDRGVLHFAAMFGSREGLLGLAALGGLLRANSGNCKLDINARDFEGKTPREYFNARDPPPGPELRAAFESFVRAVQGVSDHAGGENGDEDEDSEEEFVDAREVQEV